jgi:hypothetical protein
VKRNTSTREQASGKWCPFARTYDYTGDMEVIAGVNEPGTRQRSAACVADGCMAWRWAEDVGEHYQRTMRWTEGETEPPHQVPGLTFELYTPDPEEEPGERPHWIETRASFEARRRGYCGLAGSIAP